MFGDTETNTLLPESMDAYTIPEAWTGEGVAEAIAAEVTQILTQDREEFLKLCHQCKLTNEQASALFANVGILLARSLTEANSQSNTRAEQAIAELWPHDAERNLAIARRGAQYLKIGNDLDSCGLSTNPLVLRLAHAIGHMIGEDAMRSPGTAAPALPTGEAARAAMLKLIATSAYRRNEPDAIRKVQELAARVGKK